MPEAECGTLAGGHTDACTAVATLSGMKHSSTPCLQSHSDIIHSGVCKWNSSAHSSPLLGCYSGTGGWTSVSSLFPLRCLPPPFLTVPTQYFSKVMREKAVGVTDPGIHRFATEHHHSAVQSVVARGRSPRAHGSDSSGSANGQSLDCAVCCHCGWGQKVRVSERALSSMSLMRRLRWRRS